MGKIRYFYTSHVGKCRKANQDNFYCNGAYMPSENSGTEGILTGKVKPEENPVFAVFDGMGGEECGEMAAFLATKTMAEHCFKEDMAADLLKFCKQANEAICAHTRTHTITSMGTTAAILRFTPQKAGLCDVGDSKIYLYADGKLSQLSYDHVGISVGGRKPPLTQNLGIEESELVLDPFVAMGDYGAGDVFLLCSDGLTDMVSEQRIAEILKNKPKTAARLLLAEALENGGRDNITFILACMPKKSIWKRLKEVCICRQN